MRTLKVCVNCIPKKIPIGHVGENVVEAIKFDYSAWKTTYGEGTLNIVLQRSPDVIPYAVDITDADGLYIVTSTDLEYQGAVRAQLVYNVTGNPVPVKKSDVFLLGVDVSLGDAGDIPDPWQSWLDRVLQASDQAQEAVEHYPKVENGYWYVWNVSTESWTNTGQKAQGEEGAPGVGVASTVLNADYTLTITLTDGTSYTTPSIRGATGNGIASTVLNADYTLTITFTDGTSYTTPSIRGAQGIPGQDYVITSADYDEIASRVDTMIDSQRQQALDDIDDAETDAIGNVSAEGTTQVGLVTAKGEEVIQSIPSDYSELSDDVSELKADLTNKADVIVSDTSGTIASMSDATESKLKKAVFQINPVQDLHGQEYPYPAGGGKNLLNPQTVPDTNEYISALNGSASAPSSTNVLWRRTAFIPVTPGTQLYFGQINATDSTAGTAFYDSSYGYIRGASATGLSTANNVLTVPENAVYMRHSWRIDEGYNTDWQNTVYITLNSNPHEWTPYENICPITGHTSLDAVVGVNLLSKDVLTFKDNTGKDSNGNETTSSVSGLSMMFPVEPGTTYVFNVTPGFDSMRLCFFQSDGTWISRTGPIYNDFVPYTFTTPSNCGKIQIIITMTCYKSASFAPCLTKGTDTTVYPQANVTHYSWESEAGTVYDGTLTINDDGTGTIVYDMAKVVLNGTEKNYYWFSKFKQFSANLPSGSPAPFYDQNEVTYMSDTFKAVCNSKRGDNIGNYICILSNGTVYGISKNDWESEADARAWLASNPVELVYELATPVVINLTEQEVIELVKGTNNVWCDTGGTEIEYRADTKLYIDGKFAELQSLIANS